MANSLLNKIKAFFWRIPSNKHDMHTMLKRATSVGLVEPDTLNMLEGVLDVQDSRVTDVMVPRLQMVTLEHNMDLDKILPLMVQSRHSRFPVLGENKDEVLGIVLAKDLLGYSVDKQKKFAIQDIMRPVLFIPESKRLNVLLQDFRLNRNHMAMVVDEYGRIIGLITIEDVLEQIVGEIEDEYDTEDTPAIREQKGGGYMVKALTSVEDFNDFFNSNIDADNVETIGGLVSRAFGHVPKRGESVQVANFTFTVLRADHRRVHLLSVKQQAEE